MEKKYQIFISSTYTDLIEERTRVRDTILSMLHFPVGMEIFGAADEEQSHCEALHGRGTRCAEVRERVDRPRLPAKGGA